MEDKLARTLRAGSGRAMMPGLPGRPGVREAAAGVRLQAWPHISPEPQQGDLSSKRQSRNRFTRCVATGRGLKAGK